MCAQIEIAVAKTLLGRLSNWVLILLKFRCFFRDDRLRDELQGEAECVDLRERCKFFYGLGRKLCTLQDLDGNEELAEFFLNTFTQRFKGMLTNSHVCSNETREAYSKVLSNEELERKLFSLSFQKKNLTQN